MTTQMYFLDQPYQFELWSVVGIQDRGESREYEIGVRARDWGQAEVELYN